MSGSVWVKVHPDYAGGGNGTLDPAELVSDPVAVGSADPPEAFTVKLNDGTSKKIWFLPGNTTTASPSLDPYSLADNVYEVQLSPGSLQGVMVAAGGQGGGGAENPAQTGGGGGAGGVIGSAARVPVILPSAENETYTITVPPTTRANNTSTQNHLEGKNCSIAIKGSPAFAVAVGGGKGTASYHQGAIQATIGGSGGGAGSWTPGAGNAAPYNLGADGVDGQGHHGGAGLVSGYGGGGGGYGGDAEGPKGGAGMDLVAALNIDDSDAGSQALLNRVSDNGFIASGGGGTTGDQVLPGGGSTGGPNNHAQNYTGGGSGRTSTNGAKNDGGCGMVLLVTEV